MPQAAFPFTGSSTWSISRSRSIACRLTANTRFFFSSRRRHTISKRDWSSDVCSSDLGEDNYHRAHLGVDVAEDVRNPFAIEVDGAGRAGFVEPEVEALPGEQGKYIVEPGIAVGKIDRRPRGDDQQVRLECLVLLLQHSVHRSDCGSAVGVWADWSEPHDCRVRRRNVRSSLQDHATGDVNVLSPRPFGH